MSADDLLFSSWFSTCLDVYLLLLCLGIANSGLVEWGKAMRDSLWLLRLAHHAEAWTRMVCGGCLTGASLIVAVVAGSGGDIPTATLIVKAFMIPAVVSGLISFSLMAVRYTFFARGQLRERQRQDG